MRLFTGIDISPQVRDALGLLIGRLRPTAAIRWSRPENLHITTKFVGEWPEGRLQEMVSALKSVSAAGVIEIEIRGLGWFPNPHSPRVFWAGIHSGPALSGLAGATEQALARLGVAVENRPFSPHLTLARISEPKQLAGLRQAVAALDSVDFGRFSPRAFHLFLSDRGPQGSVYTKLAEFPLP